MKNYLLSIIVAIATSITVFAQTPQAFKYQAIVRDNAGEIIANQTVSFRISIRDGSPGGTIVYQESHSSTTNEFGLANLEIGNGSPLTGLFTDIDWSSNAKFLEVEMDPAGGSSYISMGITQLLSVPYAMYAETAGSGTGSKWTENGDNIFNNNAGNVGVGTNAPGAKLEVAGHIWQTGTGNSVFLGENAGLNDDFSSNNNVGIGYRSLEGISAGSKNVAIGSQSGTLNSTGSNNTLLGFSSGYSSVGNDNTYIGFQSGNYNGIGLKNTMIGSNAGSFNFDGTGNTFVGSNAGQQSNNGSLNVFLGYYAGYSETGSNKLYIENSNADKNNALIYGEFDNNILAINGNVGIGTTAPSSALEVNGNVTANAYYGDGSNLTGISTNQVWDTTGTNIYNLNSGSVGIGTSTPEECAALEVNSNTKGFLPPCLTQTERDQIIDPVPGLMIYCTDCPGMQIYIGSAWVNFGAYPNQAPVSFNVHITGSLMVDSTLQGNYLYSDDEGDPEGSSLLQWFRADDEIGTNQTLISGSYDSSYTLVADDVGKYIMFQVTPVALSGSSPGTPGVSPYQGPAIWSCNYSFIDPRDGQLYPTLLIGYQCWMGRNMNIGTMINGSQDQDDNLIIEKYCYDDNSNNCAYYGGLYRWNEAMQYVTTEGAQGICPTGWHIPTDAEWMILEEAAESSPGVNWNLWGWRGTDAGGNLKEAGESHWANPNLGGTNLSGFTARGAGYEGGNGLFSQLMYQTYFWTSSLYDLNPHARWLRYDNAGVHRNTISPNGGFSVRCVMDMD